MNEFDSLALDLNYLVRQHTEYEVKISFNSLYGNINISIYKNNEHLKSFMGVHLSKRIKETIEFIKLDIAQK